MTESNAITADIYLEFVENHLPSLKSGNYRFRGKQIVQGAEPNGNDHAVFELPTFHVKVAGERFSINPAEVVSVFPPNNGLGHYTAVLPHIAFKRDTLPWERMLAESSDPEIETRLDKAPWLALLVLNEEELLTDEGKQPASVQEHQQAGDGYVKTRAILETDQVKGATWPPHLDPDENPQERFKVIYVKKAVLQHIVPSEKALTLLAHARRSRIGLKGVVQGQRIDIHDENDVLVYQNRASSDDCTIDYRSVANGATAIHIRVDDVSIADQPLELQPSDRIGDETAIVVANRFPQQGVKSIIHLVSLESRYKLQGDDSVFDFDGYDDAVPFVSLYNWSFTALTEKETFRHILLSLNHTFLFGMDADHIPVEATIDDLRKSFIAGRTRLGAQSRIADMATKELRDKDHCYFVGRAGAVYNAAGRRISEGNGTVPSNKEEASALIPGHRLHHDTATFADVQMRQIWVVDGAKLYFISEDPLAHRFLVYLLPGDDTPSLRLPSREGDDAITVKANQFLQQGYVPLPHHFRRGGTSVSWYRSPLLAGKPEQTSSDELLPAHTADALLRYDTTYGMFDTSYAAAWELGRLLCLQNKRVALSLYRWKRTHIRQLKIMEQQHNHPHLPFRANTPGIVTLPESVETWLADMSLLRGLPFRYVVPDERMLPQESLRFFYLDPRWIACLVDGALSVGRVNTGHDNAVHAQLGTGGAGDEPVISGFLLRSTVVKGWPTLQVNAYDHVFGTTPTSQEDAKNESIPSTSGLTCLRLDRLGDTVLFGLFRGNIKVLDIHEQPETTHFGFHLADAEEGGSHYMKYPMRADGTVSDTCLRLMEGVSYCDEVRVLDPLKMVEALKDMHLAYTNITSAQLALSLIEGVSRVRFIREA